DRSLNDYVNSVGQRLARSSGRPNLPWRFYIVDDKSINAFATLGGHVYVHSGLLAATRSESQLASVLGHEIGHIVGRHGLENVKRAQKYQLGALGATVLGAILGGQQGARAGEALVKLPADLCHNTRNSAARRDLDLRAIYAIVPAGYRTERLSALYQPEHQVSNHQLTEHRVLLDRVPKTAENPEGFRCDLNRLL